MSPLSFFLYLLLILPQPAGKDENEHVRCQMRLASTTLKPGASGEIDLYLTPNEGIHINTDPAMEFELDKDPHIHFTGITSLPKNEQTGYLDFKRPVRYAFTLDKKISTGKHTLKGTVRYFFCSDAEGWCNRFVQPVELTFTVRH